MNPKVKPDYIPVPEQPPMAPPIAPPIAIDGFRQVVDMLRIADPAFRESLLRRLAQRDRELAATLRRDLASEPW